MHGDKASRDLLSKTTALCRRAMLMDASDARAHAYMGAVRVMENSSKAAMSFLDEAIHLNPSFAFAYLGRGSALIQQGLPEQAKQDLISALNFSPSDPYRFHALGELAAAEFFSGDLVEALENAEKSSFLAPKYWFASILKIASLVNLGAPDDLRSARKAKEDLLASVPTFSDKKIETIPYTLPDFNDQLLSAFRRV